MLAMMIVSVRPSCSPGRLSLPSSKTLIVSRGNSSGKTGVGTGVWLMTRPAVIVTLTPISFLPRGGITTRVGVGDGVRVTVGAGVGVSIGVEVGARVGASSGVTVGRTAVGDAADGASDSAGFTAKLSQPEALAPRRPMIMT